MVALSVAMLGMTAAASVVAGAPQDERPSALTTGEMTPLPVLVSAALPTGDQAWVCLYAGGRPRSFAVLSRSCHGGEETCTVFVAAPRADDMLWHEYNVANPPMVVTSDAICDAPRRTVVGTLPKDRPLLPAG